MFYIFHGEDSHTQKEKVTELKTKLGDPTMLELNTTRLVGKGLTLGQLQDACNAMPFLAPKRLVLVENLLSGDKLDKKFLDGLAAYLPHLPESTLLFFLEEKALTAKHKLLQLAEQPAPEGKKGKLGFVRLFERPQGGQLDKWIMNRVAELGGQIQPRAANLLGSNVGNDLALLDQELQKLVMYKGLADTAVPITPEDVQLLSPYAAEVNVFDLVDALGNRNGRRAAELLQKKLEEGEEPFIIFSMFVRQFRLLLQVKEVVDGGVRTPTAVAQELKIHQFVAGKLIQQSQSFSLPQLEQIYSHLLDIDVRVKTGQTDMITALHLLVFALAS
jgi:DNA polymerase III subunit delta